ncbi:hypothetical protein OROGR_016482 [Orobanche gracilis]
MSNSLLHFVDKTTCGWSPHPDIAAPGAMILAAWPAVMVAETVTGREPPSFALLSGTSMACPHVAGVVARVKSHHQTWGPSTIRSPIMTTAINTNNLGFPITTLTRATATPHDIGAGDISTSSPLQPGLVYETELSDYNMFLCDIGYEPAKIKLIVRDIAANFSCPVNKSPNFVSNMNYPSISISQLKENEVRTVTRVVTNVGDTESTYNVVIEAPAGVDVEVIPEKLQFLKNVPKRQFQATFKMRKASREDVFGSIMWTNEKYKIRSPFVLMGNPNATYSGYTKPGNAISIILFLCQMLQVALLL